MRIKRLELVGFKSFVDPTVIDFDAPICGIVGPNGCGKSNVVDSIRWVMGEMSAKSLRGKSMEDVIFNGSEKRHPLGFAEVSLAFSTEDGIAPAAYADFSEIAITRRLYRSGESEYFINKVPARLKDVVDIFLGTGVGHRAYSIIEQGKIDFVVSAKPEERRLLIEEAAGVSKFKARKESALRKMEGTEQNLSRLKDILHEVTRQINALDRQVKKAEKYKVLKNEVRELELKLSSLTYRERKGEISELQALLDDWNRRETSSQAELSTLETDLERGRLELVEKDRVFNSIQERSFEATARLQLLDAEEGFKKKEMATLTATLESASQEVIELKGRLNTLTFEKTDQDEKRRSLASESDAARSRLEEIEREWKSIEALREEKARELGRLREERRQAENDLHRLDAEKPLYDEQCVSLRGQIARAETEWNEEGRRLEEHRIKLQEKADALTETTEKGRTLHGDLETLNADIDQRTERKNLLSQELDLLQEELMVKRSRLKSLLDLERNFEGYEDGVRSILQKKKEGSFQTGLFGVVADFIETQPQYEMAVSAALGEKLQYVIVEGHAQGVEAIDYLKKESTGRSGFIPLDVREHAQEAAVETENQEGVLGNLLAHIKIREEYKKVGQYLLGDVVLMRSLSDALTLWRRSGSRKTLVTLDGEVIDAQGAVSGGAGNNGVRGKILLEKKREIKELKTLCAQMEEDIGLKEDTLSQAEGSLSEMVMQKETLIKRSQEEDVRRMTVGHDIQRLEDEFRRIEATRQKLSQDLHHIRENLEKTEAEIVRSEAKRQELLSSVAAGDQSLSLEEEESNAIQAQARQIQESLTTLRIEAAAMVERRAMAEKESERLGQIETNFQSQLEQKTAAISQANQKIALIEQTFQESLGQRDALKKQIQDLTVSQEDARREIDILSTLLRDKESRVRDVRKENDLSRSHTGDLRVTLSRAETECEHLEQSIFEKYSVALSQTAAEFELQASQAASDTDNAASPAVFDREIEDARLSELKAKLDQMGDVNMGAIPEYEELKQRQEFLSKQVQDLEDSLEALKKAITRIHQTSKARFEATFAMVNERFQTLFPRLFHGGRAEMRLVEGPEGTGLMNAGVELLVQPPGKKLSHISLMSGGEKAMAAVAFVFSIFLVKPSPFCILDEVDAPLDDLNTQRFHDLLAEMTPRTQFILITHNRRTMERADLLYGVTMQEPGCSQLVSVRINEAMKLAS